MNERKILVLDDEPDIRDSLAAYLEDCGFSVLPVGSGEEALASLSEVCVAIVDIRLRGMDGLTFIKKAHALRPDILYIIHTGSTEFQLDDELRALGMTDAQVLFKPVLDIGVFDRLIRERISRPGA